jgi:uncharacterized protein (DUF2267 family)
MRATRRLAQLGVLTACVVGAVAAVSSNTRVGHLTRQLGDRVARDLRYAIGSMPGIRYRLEGRRPDPGVGDDILADRVRSTLGPLEKRLDVPRVHVMVEEGIAILHGDVTDVASADSIERAVMRVSGIDAVESHLHAGLGPGDTRPSEGRAAPRPPSEALQALLDAARAGGAQEPRAAVHAVLCGFSDRIPIDERVQVFAHLPADVRALTEPPRRHGARSPRLRTLPQLVTAITAEGGIEPQRAEAITRSVLGAFRAIVRDEARDISAVLPLPLRELWEGVAMPADASTSAGSR